MNNNQQRLQQGIEAAVAGERDEAYHLLTEVVAADEHQPLAWLWLSQVADRMEDKITSLENVLALEPDHAVAKPLLAWLQSQQSVTLPEPLLDDMLPDFPEPEAVAEAVEVKLPDPVPSTVLPYVEAEKGGAILVDEFEDELLCVYCAHPTQEADKICPHCQHPLWQTKPISLERSQWLWRGCWLQLGLTFYLMVTGVVYFGFAARMAGVEVDLVQLLPLYVGLLVDQPAEQVTLMLQTIPIWQVWGYILGLIYSIILTLMLFFRWKHGNIVYFLHTGLMLILALLVAVLLADSRFALAACMLTFVIGVVQLLIAMNIANDFNTATKRIKLKIDSGVKGHTTLYLTGREYSRLGQWGLAVIHLRRAVAHKPGNLTYLTALAKAYLELKRVTLATDILHMAEQVEPNSAEVQALKAQLKMRNENLIKLLSISHFLTLIFYL